KDCKRPGGLRAERRQHQPARILSVTRAAPRHDEKVCGGRRTSKLIACLRYECFYPGDRDPGCIVTMLAASRFPGPKLPPALRRWLPGRPEPRDTPRSATSTRGQRTTPPPPPRPLS